MISIKYEVGEANLLPQKNNLGRAVTPRGQAKGFWERQNSKFSKKISDCQVWWGKDEQEEDFQGSENILYDTAMMDTRHTFAQTHRIYETKSEPFSKLWI